MNETGEIKRILKKNLEISQESFKLLKKMYRAQRFARLFKMFYWCIIIALMFGAYYYIQPLILSGIEIFQDIKADLSTVGGTSRTLNRNTSPGILEQLQGLFGG